MMPTGSVRRQTPNFGTPPADTAAFDDAYSAPDTTPSANATRPPANTAANNATQAKAAAAPSPTPANTSTGSLDEKTAPTSPTGMGPVAPHDTPLGQQNALAAAGGTALNPTSPTGATAPGIGTGGANAAHAAASGADVSPLIQGIPSQATATHQPTSPTGRGPDLTELQKGATQDVPAERAASHLDDIAHVNAAGDPFARGPTGYVGFDQTYGDNAGATQALVDKVNARVRDDASKAQGDLDSAYGKFASDVDSGIGFHNYSGPNEFEAGSGFDSEYGRANDELNALNRGTAGDYQGLEPGLDRFSAGLAAYGGEPAANRTTTRWGGFDDAYLNKQNEAQGLVGSARDASAAGIVPLQRLGGALAASGGAGTVTYSPGAITGATNPGPDVAPTPNEGVVPANIEALGQGFQTLGQESGLTGALDTVYDKGSALWDYLFGSDDDKG